MEALGTVQFLENDTLDLVLLMVCPERLLKAFRILTLVWQLLGEALAKRVRSLAKKGGRF